MWRLNLTVLLLVLNSAPPAAAAEARGIEVAIFEPMAADAPGGNAGLFTGVNDFDDESLKDLQFAVHDAIELAYLFVNELKLIPAQHCYVLLAGEPAEKARTVRDHLAELRRQGAPIVTATRSEILKASDKACRHGKEPKDLLVVGFSSHGFEEGQPFIMPSDGLRNRLSLTALPLATIEQEMQKSQAGHRLLLVDACQERVSAKDPSGAGGTPMGVPFADELKKSTGQTKLASCSPGELSYEDGAFGGVGHGIFSYAFLEALRGDAPADAQNRRSIWVSRSP